MKKDINESMMRLMRNAKGSPSQEKIFGSNYRLKNITTNKMTSKSHKLNKNLG
jgi:hypothetical protein